MIIEDLILNNFTALLIAFSILTLIIIFMKKFILLLLISCSLFHNLPAQSVIEHRIDYILNAIDVFSKFNGQLLVVEKVIKDENGEVISVQYINLNGSGGIGLTRSILCGINLQGSTNFYDVNYPKEVAFPCDWTWMNGVMSIFSINRNDYRIKGYDQLRIVGTGGGAGKIADKTFQENPGVLTYGSNGKDITFDEIAIISKGKSVRDRVEKDRLPSYRMDYKEHEVDGTTFFEYNRYKISTAKETKGKRQNEVHERYSYKKTGDLALITKDNYSSSGVLQTKTTYKYKNYSLQSSSSYNANNILVDSVFCDYNELGFISTQETYSLKAGKLIHGYKYEYTYQKKEGEDNLDGRYRYSQMEIRTSFNDDGTPLLQQKDDSGLYRRHFENGVWGEWQRSMY